VLSFLTVWALSGSVAMAADDTGPGDVAGDDVRARELWENGAILYSEGRYEDAILAWDEAYRLSERHLILTNIANAEERLGLWRDALETLNRYRAFAPAAERDALDRRIANLERRLAEQGPVAAGAATPAPSVQSRGGGKGLPVALLLGGVAGAASGTAFGLLTRAARTEATALCVGLGDDLLCPTSASDALDRDRNYSIVADASMTAGALLLAAGVVTLYRARGPGPQVQASFLPGAGGGLVVLTGGF
jgi:tetratricopeptide (TPR) repeat protein